MTFKDKAWSKIQQINQSKAVKKTWEWADKVGEQTNKLSGKLGTEAFYPTDLGRECEKAARILRTFTQDGVAAEEEVSGYGDQSAHKKTQKVLKKIPPRALEQAQGIAIFTVMRMGLGWSGAGGSGIVVRRQEDGSWSPPSGILIHTIGVGFLAGIDVYDCVVILRHQKAIDAFTKPQVKLGAELAVAAGPVGNGFTLDAGLDAKPAWSYTKSKGLYGGAQLDGTIIVLRIDENARFYGQPKVHTEDILNGLYPWPTGAGPQGLYNTLLVAEGKHSQADLSLIPDGPTLADQADKLDHDAIAQHQAEAEAAASGGQPQPGFGMNAAPAQGYTSGDLAGVGAGYEKEAAAYESTAYGGPTAYGGKTAYMGEASPSVSGTTTPARRSMPPPLPAHPTESAGL